MTQEQFNLVVDNFAAHAKETYSKQTSIDNNVDYTESFSRLGNKFFNTYTIKITNYGDNLNFTNDTHPRTT